jgi:hypothetical protein
VPFPGYRSSAGAFTFPSQPAAAPPPDEDDPPPVDLVDLCAAMRAQQGDWPSRADAVERTVRGRQTVTALAADFVEQHGLPADVPGAPWMRILVGFLSPLAPVARREDVEEELARRAREAK